MELYRDAKEKDMNVDALRKAYQAGKRHHVHINMEEVIEQIARERTCKTCYLNDETVGCINGIECRDNFSCRDWKAPDKAYIPEKGCLS